SLLRGAARRAPASFPTRRSSDLDGLVTGTPWSPPPEAPSSDASRGEDAPPVPSPAAGEGPAAAPVEVEQTRMQVPGYVLYLDDRSEEHTSELQSRFDLVCRLLLE